MTLTHGDTLLLLIIDIPCCYVEDSNAVISDLTQPAAELEGIKGSMWSLKCISLEKKCSPSLLYCLVSCLSSLQRLLAGYPIACQL